jgi:hypothetical protein
MGANNASPRAGSTVYCATTRKLGKALHATANHGAHRGGNHGAGGGIDPRFREGRLCAAPPHQATDCTGRAMPNHEARLQRHGTTTLFATLSVLDGTVIGGCMQRHRHIETRCRKADCRPTRWSRRLEQPSISRRYSATLARYRYRADRIR